VRETVLREFPNARVVDVRSPTAERPERTLFVVPTSNGEDAFTIFQTLRSKGAADVQGVRVEERD
jgi:hypothetical protein